MRNVLSQPSIPSIEPETSQDLRLSIVLEGKSGISSIAEICRREGISHETFLNWSKELLQLRHNEVEKSWIQEEVYTKYRSFFKGTVGLDVFDYIENYIDFSKSDCAVVLRSEEIITTNENENLGNIICLDKTNDIRYINKHFESINEKLPLNGIFVGAMETFSARKKRKFMNKVPIFGELYFGFEFMFKRILPKLALTKKYYFDITKGNDRLMSKAEGLGRLVSCGFRIMDFKTINGMLYFVVKKIGSPEFNMSPSYGPIYKMPRLGKNGNIIGVYKFRTMHPYSEYLQDYIVNAHGYAETGKPANDFRIPIWGKFMRRFWLDELPQLLNVLKGDMKLVGVRPVSQRYFQDIPKEMQKLRLTQKPGCIPPYVALNRKSNVMSVLEAEMDYLKEKVANPYSTDLKYFLNAIINIVFKKKRSS
jgi:lipopolysaccharide/colanic/teichoic acid biosynthesis glycosyltransferase